MHASVVDISLCCQCCPDVLSQHYSKGTISIHFCCDQVERAAGSPTITNSTQPSKNMAAYCRKSWLYISLHERYLLRLCENRFSFGDHISEGLDRLLEDSFLHSHFPLKLLQHGQSTLRYTSISNTYCQSNMSTHWGRNLIEIPPSGHWLCSMI